MAMFMVAPSMVGHQDAERVHAAPSTGMDVDVPIVLFDGDCGLCHGAVKWILRHDQLGTLLFAPLQAPWVQAELQARGTPADMSSMVVLQGASTFVNSEAACRAAMAMGGWPSVAGRWALYIPRVLRDAAYKLIATYRYRIFGKTDGCLIAPAGTRQRILSAESVPAFMVERSRLFRKEDGA